MNKNIINFSIFLFGGYFLVFPQLTYAVIPPDFIFSIGTQIAQFFSIILIFFTAVFGTFFQFFKAKFYEIKHKKIVLISTLFLIVSISLILSYFYAIYQQKVEYQKWFKESEEYNATQNINYENFENVDENNQLNIGGDSDENIDVSSDRFISKIDMVDDSARFINEYYENIANGNMEHAYAMSKKTVDFNTFQGWYSKTTKITLDNLVRIDDKKSSIELTLYEGVAFTRYGVLMTLTLQETKPISVEKSEVKVLSQGMIEDKNILTDESTVFQEYDFFVKNENTSIVITNQGFKNIIDDQQNNYIVLDARENIEYENGYFLGSLHVRFADLKAGRWIELPKDKIVYVICWSGIRGKEVAEFLRTKKIVSSYLENGANGWVEFGGKWFGNIKFGEKYTDPKYQIVFNTDEVKDRVKEGVVLVDTREPYKFKQWHISGSINIPIMYTPTTNIENVFNQVPVNSRVITVCDGYVNCFDAKITGVELERRGNQFLGRYNKPWEYEK